MPSLSENVTPAPKDEIRPVLTAYFELGLNGKNLVKYLQYHYDTSRYGLGPKSVREEKKRDLLSR
ncbi:hypothetical protein B0H34DRAFT_862938 [Crassisporium funariophilum]|nr:hypothetical protein B0H34DRAFT_862938 [Crassisporium funariophilum]